MTANVGPTSGGVNAGRAVFTKDLYWQSPPLAQTGEGVGRHVVSDTRAAPATFTVVGQFESVPV
jgi:hypothetical protein